MVIIPLEGNENLQDPRINTCKHALSTQTEEEPNKKTRKTCIEEDPLQTRSTLKIEKSPHTAGFVEKTLGKDSTRKPESTIAEKSCFMTEDKQLEKVQMEEDHMNQPIDASLIRSLTLSILDTPQDPKANLKEDTLQKKIGNILQETTFTATICHGI